MDEIVALDSNKQKKFVKSIKGIKKLIKKNDAEAQAIVRPVTEDGKSKKRRFKQKGLVYLSHIPHGFYENQMTQYFKQFGKVTNARVIRSKRTGNSKGYAFVEFGEPAVAQIVAETMNNYLMGKRLIKAAYVPPEKQRRHALRKHWSVLNNPGTELRNKLKKQFNENKTDDQELIRAKKLLKNLSHTKSKLKALDINYDFFRPVDVPEALQNTQPKLDAKTVLSTSKKNKKSDASAKVEEKSNAKKKVVKKSDVNAENVKQKKQKQQKMKAVGVRPPENFIKVAQSETEESSDGSDEFDSDEFEKSLEMESELESDEVEDGSEDDGGSEEELPIPHKKGNLKNKAVKSKPVQSIQVRDSKRKAPQKVAASEKKQKFEKKGTQNKLFKRK